jgi:hypothetical protein
LATEQDFTAEKLITDETPAGEVPEYTQYVDEKYAAELMAETESVADDDLRRPACARVQPRRPRSRLRNQSSPRADTNTQRVYKTYGGNYRAISKDLRERTGAGMMECKSALTEAKGDLGEAEIVLRREASPRRGRRARAQPSRVSSGPTSTTADSSA